MAFDNHKRAVLSIAALTQLVVMKRGMAPDDAAGRVTVEFLERLVINGSVTERDEVLKAFEKDASFVRALASKRAPETA
ncbi:MAG: hypothetical protein V4713_08035 [Pseudomonadota bacterium]